MKPAVDTTKPAADAPVMACDAASNAKGRPRPAPTAAPDHARAEHRQHPRLLLDRRRLRECRGREHRAAAALRGVAHRLVADHANCRFACGLGERLASGVMAVSYTHLTLPTI